MCMRTSDTVSAACGCSDCVIHKAPDGFAGLRRVHAETRTWLKELTLLFERLANDYIMLVFIINCHLEIQVQKHCKR